MPKLVLASASPRRSELLAALGVDFVVDAADIPERNYGDPATVVQRLARSKAEVVASRHPSAVVLAADTIVNDGAFSYGKPLDEANAESVLTELCGNEHQVFTGIAAVSPRGVAASISVSNVWLSPFTAHEIADYVRNAGHNDKAGAYAIQDDANPIVERFEGCYCSIMGLPLWEAYRFLKQADLDVAVPSGAIVRCSTCPERTRSNSTAPKA